MQHKIHPGVVSAVIVVVVLAIGFFVWRLFARPAQVAAGTAENAKTRQATVTRGPDGRLQFSPEAQAQRGPRRFPNTTNGAPTLH